jgi:hypothetical protein
MGNADKKDPKKLYEPPTLSVFGKIEELTQKIGTTHSFDHGSGFRIRTGIR